MHYDVILNPVAYIKILMHTKRFWNENINEKKRALAYGVLTGYVKDKVRHITDYIPLLHSKYEIDFEKKHSIFMKIDSLNQDLARQAYRDYIVGWVKATNSDDVDVTRTDKKNQLYLQTTYNESAVTIFILIPLLEYDWGISVRGFIDPISTLDLNSLVIDLDWDFDDGADIDRILDLLRDLHKIKKNKSTLIKEYKEVTISIPK
ncbi:MAG: hypothetical protein GF364_02060 [Candidatus Lokiarchaeota archaeon]|nr:hypothetical protein [Candidatus Lokiarchaeota archaeon]